MKEFVDSQVKSLQQGIALYNKRITEEGESTISLKKVESVATAFNSINLYRGLALI